jgi:threonyl-tRNA synthetase
MGTIGRFMGIILENSKGSLPLWVSPVQARVINITERNREYAAKVSKSLEEAGLRVELDDSSRTLEYKVRESQLIKAYYTIILGDKEESGNVIAIRARDGKTKYNVKLDEFIEEATKKIKERTIN